MWSFIPALNRAPQTGSLRRTGMKWLATVCEATFRVTKHALAGTYTL